MDSVGPETLKSIKIFNCPHPTETAWFEFESGFYKVHCWLFLVGNIAWIIKYGNGNFEWTAQWVRVLDRISHFVLFVASEMLIITFKSLSEQLKIFKKKWFTKKNYLEYFFEPDRVGRTAKVRGGNSTVEWPFVHDK